MSLNKNPLIGTAMFAVAAVMLAGCGKSTPNVASNKTTNASTASADDHSGWWCDKHGVPEEKCALCSSKVATELKAKGDWCSKHDRPDSQCFACHPEFQTQFAKLYQEKLGKEPPKPTDNG